MNILVFGRIARPYVAAVVEGARALGWKSTCHRLNLVSVRDGVRPNTSALFVDGLHGFDLRILDQYRAKGVPVVIMELPRLRNAPDAVGMYRETLHDLPEVGGNIAMVAGIIEERAPEYLLVCGQKPNDTAHGKNALEMTQWARETVRLARHYGLPVIYRPHPSTAECSGLASTVGADGASLPSKETLRDAMTRAHAVITYNSTAGVDAIDAGVPVLYTAHEEVIAYHQYASRLGMPLRVLSMEERQACLARFAASQWSLDQVRDGTALRCLLEGAPLPPFEEVVVGRSALPSDRPTDATVPDNPTPSAPGNVTPPSRGKRSNKRNG